MPRRNFTAQLPEFIAPELAQLADHAPTGDDWLSEIKFDGYRLGARLEGGKARMLTRRGLDWTGRFRPIAEAVARLPARNAYLDGEAAVLDDNGISVFAELQDALSARRAERITYHVFDLLWLDGEDLRPLPLVQRKARLKKLLGKRPPARWPIRAMWSVGGLRSSADPPPEPPPAEPRAPASWRG